MRVTGEYSWGTGGINNPFFSSESSDEKYYVMGTYRLNDLFEVGSYYSENFNDKNDKEGVDFDPYHAAFQKDWALTLRVDPVRYLIFKLEYHKVERHRPVDTDAQPGRGREELELFCQQDHVRFLGGHQDEKTGFDWEKPNER